MVVMNYWILSHSFGKNNLKVKVSTNTLAPFIYSMPDISSQAQLKSLTDTFLGRNRRKNWFCLLQNTVIPWIFVSDATLQNFSKEFEGLDHVNHIFSECISSRLTTLTTLVALSSVQSPQTPAYASTQYSKKFSSGIYFLDGFCT